MRFICGSGTFNHESLGLIKYTVRSSARRVTARWRPDMLSLTLPPGMTAGQLEDALKQMEGRLLARRPKESPYSISRTFDFGDFSISIKGVDGYGQRCSTHQTSRTTFEIRLDSAAETDRAEVIKAIGKAMRAIARFTAPGILLPRARELADKVEKHPIKWEISSGLRVLGHCNSRGVIALSYFVVFLPEELRDYIIYHELAHLTEMNHSAAFHRICNEYCGGRERALIAALRACSPISV